MVSVRHCFRALLLLVTCSLSTPFQPITATRYVHHLHKDIVRRSMAADPASAASAGIVSSSSTQHTQDGNQLKRHKVPFPVILWRFTRPHTILGSAFAIPSLHALAAPSLKQAFSLPILASCAYVTLPSLLMNLYITGLNQVTDVEVDRVNKPNLPIASGDLTTKQAIIIISIALLLSLSMGILHPLYNTAGFNLALWGSFLLGTLYSLPPFRLKRFPLMAAICIVAVRGTIINSGFFAHAKSAVFASAQPNSSFSFVSYFMDPKCLLSSLYFAIFGIVIALMKDVPDATGDALFKIRTFTVRLGQKSIFNLSRRMFTSLLLAVGLGFGYSATCAPSLTLRLCRSTVSLSAITASWIMRKRASLVLPEDSNMVYNYYMELWKVFYLSYLVLPFAR